jgi:hypothetical protein
MNDQGYTVECKKKFPDNHPVQKKIKRIQQQKKERAMAHEYMGQDYMGMLNVCNYFYPLVGLVVQLAKASNSKQNLVCNVYAAYNMISSYECSTHK